MRITPYFEINGNRYEFKRTRWLIAEYRRLNEENPLSDEDKANAIKASNLVADVKKFAEKEKECWEKLCDEPTEENQRVYLMFKGMSDKAIADYNAFVSTNNTLQTATKHSIDILEIVAIKALAEQYYSGNEKLARQTWEQFVDEIDDHDKVAEWLNAMAECLFGEEDNEEDTGFLAQKRKADMERENNRKNALRKKR
jgi:hypothetical protein